MLLMIPSRLSHRDLTNAPPVYDSTASTGSNCRLTLHPQQQTGVLAPFYHTSPSFFDSKSPSHRWPHPEGTLGCADASPQFYQGSHQPPSSHAYSVLSVTSSSATNSKWCLLYTPSDSPLR